MKARYKAAIFLAAFLLLLPFWGGAPQFTHAAEQLGAYDYTVERYDVAMTVAPDRSVAVREEFTVSFSDYDSHGVIRDLPLEEGLRYRDFVFGCDNGDFSPYVRIESSDSGSDFYSVYLRGKGLVKGQERTYTLSYTMLLPDAFGSGEMRLDVIGFGMQSTLKNVTAKVTVPDGLHGFEVSSSAVTALREGNTISLSAERLSRENGVTLKLLFEDGALSAPAADLSVLYAVLIGAGLLVLAVLCKFFLCRRPVMTATVNLEAPEQMDPLLMGKLIDGAVDNEDLGAAIFYFADKGYLKIKLDDEKDPELILKEPLPPDAPEHLKIVFEGLFAHRERVSASELNCAFYRTAQRAKAATDGAAGSIHTPRSNFLTGLFGVLSVLFLGGFPFLYNLLLVYGGYFYWQPALFVLIAYAVSAFFCRFAKQREEKWKRVRTVFHMIGGVLLGALPALAILLFPAAGMSAAGNVLLILFADLAGAVGGNFLTDTEEHAKRLGQILGFKQFILYTERDKIEFMLKEDPELYYHILPYAQVLGVTDAWTNKFKGLTLKPPAYAYGHDYSVFDVIVFNRIYLNMANTFSRTMVSRPSSSGGGGGHFGGSGGSFGGSGFGGGGMRGC